MEISKRITRLFYLRGIISKGQLASPEDLTEKFQCSEKTIRRMINTLRDMGYEIQYCKKNRKYFLLNE